ncbi:hypothetical protein HDE_04371 [Halotydeus destructor]|nr:hypothetical protein HDE_04371 [Halotydeus destructor]
MKFTLLSLVFAAAILVKVSQAQNTYRVSVFFDSGSKFKQEVEGKLHLYVYTGNGRFSTALSTTTEKFKKGSVKEYLVQVPVTADQVNRVGIEWSYKRSLTSPSTWLKSYKLYFDRILLEPTYIIDYNQRSALLKGFCNVKRPKGIFAGEEVPFDLRC